MPGRERGETGQYVETVRLEDVLAVFDRVRGPVITSSDVAEALDCTTEAARQKLTRLYDQGKVDKRKTGRTVVYWRTEVAELADTREAPPRHVSQVEEQADQTDTPEEQSRETAHIPGQDVAPETLADVEFPGGRDRDQCEAAICAARVYLREHGPATMREIVTAVMPEHPVGYDVPELEPGERYRGAWWRRVVKPGLKALPDVTAPSRGASDWSYSPNTARGSEPNG